MNGTTTSLYIKYQAQKGVTNRVVDPLKRRIGLVEEVLLQSVGIDSLNHLYVGELDFGEAFEVCTEMVDKYHANFSKYLIQNEFLFKGDLL